MTLKRQILNKRALRAGLPLAGLGAVAAALSGCGGATQNGANITATHDSGPVIYGINANANRSIATQETSGLSFTTGTTTTSGAVIGVTSYITNKGPGPLFTYQSTYPNGTLSNGVTSSPGLPLGFAVGASYFNVSSKIPIIAMPTNASNLIFGAYASASVVNNFPVDIVASSIVLTSSESPTFSLPLIFSDPTLNTGVLVQPQYKSAPFAVPTFMQTTGLHDLRTTVADVDGNSSTTDFAVATVAPTDVALFLQSITVLVPAVAATATTPVKPATTVTTAINSGDLVTIDGGTGIGAYPTGYTPTVADGQGTVVLFTTPGTHTLTETDPKGKVVQTETFTLGATTAGTTLLTPPAPDGAPAASARPLVIHPAIKSAIKR